MDLNAFLVFGTLSFEHRQYLYENYWVLLKIFSLLLFSFFSFLTHELFEVTFYYLDYLVNHYKTYLICKMVNILMHFKVENLNSNQLILAFYKF